MKIELISASNPRYMNADKTAITLDCEFSHLPGEIYPFAAMPIDVEEHGRDVYARAIAGEFGPIAEYIPPPPRIPKIVSMRQARLALLNAGLLANVEAAVNSAGQSAQIEWQYAQELKRDNPVTQQIAAALGLTEQQIDNLFIEASKL